MGINTSFLDLGFNNLRKVPNLALRKLVKTMMMMMTMMMTMMMMVMVMMMVMMMVRIMFEVAVMMMGIGKMVRTIWRLERMGMRMRMRRGFLKLKSL